MQARPCQRPDCPGVIPESAHSNRRYCDSDECQMYRRRAASKASYARNREGRSAQLRAYNRANRPAERKRYHERYRVRKLAKSYKTTMAVIHELLAIESCEICGRIEDLTIDHDHETGHIRGRLCQRCNRAIGLIGDDPSLLAAAITYLEGDPRWLDANL